MDSLVNLGLKIERLVNGWVSESSSLLLLLLLLLPLDIFTFSFYVNKT